MRLLTLVGRSVLCSSLLPLPRKQNIDKRALIAERISRRLCAPPMVLSTGKECISFVAFRRGFHSSGSFRTAGRWTSSARECHSPSFGHLSIAFVGQGENFSPWQQTLRLLWPFSRPLTFLSSFTLFDVLYTYSLVVDLFPSLSLSLPLSLSLSMCGVADLYLHVLLDSYRGVIFFRIFARFVSWALRPFVRMKFSYSRWPLRILCLALYLSHAFFFRTEATAYEIYENNMPTKYSGFTVVTSRHNQRKHLRDHRSAHTTTASSAPQHAPLQGARRVRTQCLFVSGISPDNTADEVIKYCRERSVQVTGCYLLRSKIWGTQLAKLFVSTDHVEEVRDRASDFWPEHITCRSWERDPPKRASNAASKDQWMEKRRTHGLNV